MRGRQKIGRSEYVFLFQTAICPSLFASRHFQKQMRYCDLHCDALTKERDFQVTKENLTAGGCYLQCFAAFISVRKDRYDSALTLCDRFDALCKEEGYHPVRRSADLKENAVNALLTVEEGGAIDGDLQKLDVLYERGVRMMTLTWNYPNEIGFPNFPDFESLKEGKLPFTARETSRGLTEFGRETVERMNLLGMLADVSHGSDKLFYDVAEICGRANIPFVASHSGADSVYACARNLTDKQLSVLGDLGGVVGLDFCADFLSGDLSVKGQKDAILAHARAIVNAGGEDVLALGSDFDGIPENSYLRNPAYVPDLLDVFSREFGSRITEKIARNNFLRVFQEVCQ